MPRYKVEHPYASGPVHQRIGPWEPGQEMDLSEEEAARINQDSPGTLSPVVSPTDADDKEPEEETEAPAPAKRQARAGRDRQQRGGANRSS